ncbi:cysteine desulfurase [Aphanomyces invadans]|uniref:Cysteine desulfurase n=1 Tax=Aphanomyces invadans TaxID=157072 RepID=A0A024T8R1_9STRA|nr:cysteine desulfurase [Aphanomyces invadans]ETV90374.1 cysteine desulfurase [Aphanomyces invadans]RHY29089.1 hypothetical protein DYB32_005440 [Aphanomyces invadans]|eukprot:XP_008880984.1 cysteine desulfurase [Aphanomyces invadans]
MSSPAQVTPKPFSASELAAVRAEFPSLSVPNQTIFMDNAGGAQVLKRVADRVYEYLTTTSVQLGASYDKSVSALARVVQARESIATLINAKRSEEVVMGGSTTALMFLIMQAILPTIVPGDEIILTNTEHEANVGAWRRLTKAGAIIKTWHVNTTSLLLELSDLSAILATCSRPKWVAMTHASNILGTVNPVDQVAKLVHAAGARLSVDAVAYAPHRLVDVQASGADMYVFSFYKVFGPHYAVLWGDYDLLLALPSLNHHFIAADNLPYKLQPGHVNFELSYGCQGIAEYLVHMGGAVFRGQGSPRELMQVAFDRFEQHEHYLTDLLLTFLRSKAPRVRIIGLPTLQTESKGVVYNRVATVSFVVEGKQSPELVRQMDKFNVGIRFGDFYAVQLIDVLGLRAYGGVVRVSLAHYNSVEEVQTLLGHLETLI